MYPGRSDEPVWTMNPKQTSDQTQTTSQKQTMNQTQSGNQIVQSSSDGHTMYQSAQLKPGDRTM